MVLLVYNLPTGSQKFSLVVLLMLMVLVALVLVMMVMTVHLPLSLSLPLSLLLPLLILLPFLLLFLLLTSATLRHLIQTIIRALCVHMIAFREVSETGLFGY
jgi:hypothetical protein